MARSKKKQDDTVSETLARYRAGAQGMLEWAATVPLDTPEQVESAAGMVAKIRSANEAFAEQRAVIMKPLEEQLNARIAEAAPIEECFTSALETIARRLRK